MLEHALHLNAREQHQRILVAMTPHISKGDRSKLIKKYERLMDEDTSLNGIMNDDKKRLRVLLSKIKK